MLKSLTDEKTGCILSRFLINLQTKIKAAYYCLVK